MRRKEHRLKSVPLAGICRCDPLLLVGSPEGFSVRDKRLMFSLKDKVAVVTGASQGIGRETALALAQAGAKVAVAARSEEKLAALVTEIEAAGGLALAVKMDVADADQVKAGFKQV